MIKAHVNRMIWFAGLLLLITACSLPTDSNDTPTSTLVPPPTLAPTPAPTPFGGGGGRIAFSTNRDGDFEYFEEGDFEEYSEIYAMNADGSGLTNLMNNPAADNTTIE